MSAPPPVTAVIINFRTPDLTCRAVRSFRSFYPDVPLLLIDNGSGNGSVQALEACVRDAGGNARLVANPRNLHHGPAMDLALRELQSRFVLFVDSDCVITKGGFLEIMQAKLEEREHHYATGKLILMNRRGYDVVGSANAFPYIRPICMLIKRELYLRLPPFRRHGAPCLENMRAAIQRNLGLIHVPVEEYLVHEGRGTAGRHGYRLGLRGRVNHVLNRLGM
jgi:glycosyltransferase involved in cell wall biosynthesis